MSDAAGAGSTGAAPTTPQLGTAPANDNGPGLTGGLPAGQAANDNAQAVADAVQAAGGPAALDLSGPDGDRPISLTIDGQQVTMTLREAAREMRLSKASFAKMREASAMRKQSEQLLEALQHRPGEVLRKLGPQAVRAALRDALSATMDDAAPAEIRRAVEEEFQAVLRDAGRPKAELEHERREREWQERNKSLEEREKALQEEQVQRAAKVEKRRFERAFSTALTEAKVPVTPDTIRAMAEHVSQLIEYGMPLDPSLYQEAAILVAEDMTERRKGSVAHLRDLEAEQLATELGPEALKKLAEYQLKKVQGGAPRVEPPTTVRAANDNAKPARPRSTADALREIEADRVAGRRPWEKR